MDLGSILMKLVSILVDLLFFLDFVWSARFDAKKCATSAPKVVSKM